MILKTNIFLVSDLKPILASCHGLLKKNTGPGKEGCKHPGRRIKWWSQVDTSNKILISQPVRLGIRLKSSKNDLEF